jgi:hypothetical protein
LRSQTHASEYVAACLDTITIPPSAPNLPSSGSDSALYFMLYEYMQMHTGFTCQCHRVLQGRNVSCSRRLRRLLRDTNTCSERAGTKLEATAGRPARTSTVAGVKTQRVCFCLCPPPLPTSRHAFLLSCHQAICTMRAGISLNLRKFAAFSVYVPRPFLILSIPLPNTYMHAQHI